MTPELIRPDTATGPCAGQDDTADGSACASWYLLDRADRIVAVSPDWDQAADAGQGRHGALRAGVLGQPLRRFIGGDSTVMFMATALQATRLTGRPRELPYRCDTPTMVRGMLMRLVPLPNDGLRVEHRLLSCQPRSQALHVRTRPLLRPSTGAPLSDASPAWLRCSLCLRLKAPGQADWLPPESVRADQALAVRHVVCQRCRVGLLSRH
jgi:hypothetical protein